MKELETAVNALINCPGVDGTGCSNCEWRSVSACKTTLVANVREEIERQKDFRRIMFNRCHALTRHETCDICRFREECEEERSV